jgi:hypothetical protein
MNERSYIKTNSEMKPSTLPDPAIESLKDYTVQSDIYAIGQILNFIYFGTAAVKS